MNTLYYSILLLPFVFGIILSVKEPLNTFIRHHEKLSYDTADIHKRTKRALELSPFANVEIKFTAFDHNFTLHLTRNHELFSPDFKIVDGNGNHLDYDYSRFYQGDVEGFAIRKSHCMGKVHDGRFKVPYISVLMNITLNLPKGIFLITKIKIFIQSCIV